MEILIALYILVVFVLASIVTRGQRGLDMFVLVIAAVAAPLALFFVEFWVLVGLIVLALLVYRVAGGLLPVVLRPVLVAAELFLVVYVWLWSDMPHQQVRFGNGVAYVIWGLIALLAGVTWLKKVLEG